jgi:hypothetical protein
VKIIIAEPVLLRTLLRRSAMQRQEAHAEALLLALGGGIVTIL